MADTKLSALTELATAPGDTDELYVNDSGTSKRITYGTFKAALLARANTHRHADGVHDQRFRC